ncbi:MAG: hypothetical protein AAGC66_16095 [Leifsonia sp.]
MITRRGFVIGSSLGVLAAASGALPAFAGGFAVSTDDIDITPDIGYPMGGYGADAPRLSTDVNEPLRARCTVLWDSGSPNVIVTADVLGFGPAMHLDIRSRVQALGVAGSDFVLTAIHTHNGPVLTQILTPYAAYNMSDDDADVAAYSEWLSDAIVALVQSALAAPRTDCTLDYYVLDEDFARNRAGASYQERAVPVLVARAADGTPRAVLFGYGCHPVAAGNQTMFDPDYPAEAIKRIEELSPNTFAQFVTGPAGDQNPRETGSFPISDGLGDDLGATIANAIGTPGRALAGPISTVLTSVSLPLDITDTKANLDLVRSAYQTRLSTTGGWVRRHAQQMIQQIDAHSFHTSVPVPVQRWGFTGAPGLQMLFSGGELVSGYAVYLRARHGGAQQLWVNAYANEVPSYLPSDELMSRPTYEGGWDADFPGIAGGSMTIYGHLGHFRSKTSASAPDGVEQILIRAFESVL